MSDLETYNYATDSALEPLRAFDAEVLAQMKAYGAGHGNFGEQLVAHQERVAQDAAGFLRYIEPDRSPQELENLIAMVRFHDWGKIHSTYEDPSIWHSEDRPTPEQKALQKRHAALGAQLLDEWLINHPELADHPHIKLRRNITHFHHERFDGKGPEKKDASKLSLVEQIVCIADARDGDMIPRPHQKKLRTEEEEFARLRGESEDKKYVGAFHPEVIAKYVCYRLELLKIPLTELAVSSAPAGHRKGPQ